MNYLSSRKSNWICICIVVYILITGMCFDEGKTHSLFLYSPGAKSYVTIASINAVILEQQTCIPKTLNMKSPSGILVSGDWEDKESREEACFDFVSANAVLRESGGSFLLLEADGIMNMDVSKRIANYVHRSDGKKRVCTV